MEVVYKIDIAVAALRAFRCYPAPVSMGNCMEHFLLRHYLMLVSNICASVAILQMRKPIITLSHYQIITSILSVATLQMRKPIITSSHYQIITSTSSVHLWQSNWCKAAIIRAFVANALLHSNKNYILIYYHLPLPNGHKKTSR
jgi:hypothetical protein